nr:hypothetical protein [uncultured Dyadobacter sp.]
MKTNPLLASIRKPFATGLIMIASALSIATARFERDPQSCGMMAVQTSKKTQRLAN